MRMLENSEKRENIDFNKLYNQQLNEIKHLEATKFIIKDKEGNPVMELDPVNSTGLFLLRRLGIIGRLLILKNLQEDTQSQEVAEIFKYSLWCNYMQSQKEAKELNQSGISSNEFQESLEDIDKATLMVDVFINTLCEMTGYSFATLFLKYADEYIKTITEELKKKYKGLNIMISVAMTNPKLLQGYMKEFQERETSNQT